MEKPSATTEHERKPSIDEPKTLTGKQVKIAREAAIEVINNNSPEEATKIFLAGLEPVVRLVQLNGNAVCENCGKCVCYE